MSKSATFVEACLSGEAGVEDIDDWVDSWHEIDEDEDNRTLSQFLGFSPEDKELWLSQPNVLRFIVAAHGKNVPVIDMIRQQSEFGLAARGMTAESEKAMESLIRWMEIRNE